MGYSKLADGTIRWMCNCCGVQTTVPALQFLPDGWILHSGEGRYEPGGKIHRASAFCPAALCRKEVRGDMWRRAGLVEDPRILWGPPIPESDYAEDECLAAMPATIAFRITVCDVFGTSILREVKSRSLAELMIFLQDHDCQCILAAEIRGASTEYGIERGRREARGEAPSALPDMNGSSGTARHWNAGGIH